jgi:primosomal protein N' (replication factor Y)
MLPESAQLFSQTHIWVEVILPLALPVNLTYALSSELSNHVQLGSRVEVELGKQKRYTGIVCGIHDQKPDYATKPVLSVLDKEPLLYVHQLRFWEWISQYYLCSMGEVMATALPANFRLNSETHFQYNEDFGEDFSMLDDDAYLLAEALLLKKQLTLQEVHSILQKKSVYPVIRNLIDLQVCFVWESLQEKYKPKKENYVRFHPAFNADNSLEPLLNGWKGAPKQMELLLAFIHLSQRNQEVIQSDLLQKAGANATALKSLCEKGVLQVEKRSVNRLSSIPTKLESLPHLSSMQQEGLDKIRRQFLHNKEVVLLHGVTGSGKTMLYLHLIAEQIKQGNQVLYLLPEIALTSQIIRRLQEYFGGHVAVYHSRFNDQERVELWNSVRTNQVKILLSARSGLFLPFSKLGLIIVDEEHDSSYKQQDPAPRYHARDSAIYYASLFSAKVLLGSATPSVETYHNALHGKYGLVELNERFGGLELPRIETVSNRTVEKKQRILIAPELQQAITEALEQKQQIILFQNRRGYHPYLMCSTCAHIPQCKHCDVSLTLHKFSNKLHCHYCGSTYPKLIACNACGNTGWDEKNFGTERIEEELTNLFPEARVARMDIDSVKGKYAHEALIHQFEQQKIDILVGTQMVVKGLDFERVKLVGILDADGLLSFADFRVHERAFQLMEQVSGRAGRKGEQGLVILQSSRAQHPVITCVRQHDYALFFKQEIRDRETFNYPPFSRLIRLSVQHKDLLLVRQAAEAFANSLRIDFREMVTGPADPIIPRLRNIYRMELLIRINRSQSNAAVKKAILHHIQLLLSNKRFKSIRIIADVDPI